jgi:1,4-dihydroxy-6-naphthoate synthase
LITLALSPCPNDTFSFAALALGLVEAPEPFKLEFHDIEELNCLAAAGGAELCKVSFNAWLSLRERFDLLESGAALGFGCGPLLVHRAEQRLAEAMLGPVAIPGPQTTATLLLRLWWQGEFNCTSMRFDQIPAAVAQKRCSAGLIIHEGRFTYQRLGLVSGVDLGSWWEQDTGLPLPLGGIVAKKFGPPGFRGAVAWQEALAASIRLAQQNPRAVMGFVRRYAAELEDEVIQAHIRLYVNEFSLALGQLGRMAVAALADRAASLG